MSNNNSPSSRSNESIIEINEVDDAKARQGIEKRLTHARKQEKIETIAQNKASQITGIKHNSGSFNSVNKPILITNNDQIEEIQDEFQITDQDIMSRTGDDIDETEPIEDALTANAKTTIIQQIINDKIRAEVEIDAEEQLLIEDNAKEALKDTFRSTGSTQRFEYIQNPEGEFLRSDAPKTDTIEATVIVESAVSSVDEIDAEINCVTFFVPKGIRDEVKAVINTPYKTKTIQLSHGCYQIQPRSLGELAEADELIDIEYGNFAPNFDLTEVATNTKHNGAVQILQQNEIPASDLIKEHTVRFEEYDREEQLLLVRIKVKPESYKPTKEKLWVIGKDDPDEDAWAEEVNAHYTTLKRAYNHVCDPDAEV